MAERYTAAPGKDATDLLLILKTYLDAGNQERLYKEAPHLLEDGNFDYEQAGAWFLGRDAAKAIEAESATETGMPEKILAILAREIDPDGLLALIGQMGGRDAENIRLVLAAFLNGFRGEKKP